MPKAYIGHLNENDYSAIRSASMRGKFVHDFERELESGTVTFTCENIRKLKQDLDKVIDFGTGCADDVLIVL